MHPAPFRTRSAIVSREGDLWRWDGYRASAEAPTAAATTNIAGGVGFMGRKPSQNVSTLSNLMSRTNLN